MQQHEHEKAVAAGGVVYTYGPAGRLLFLVIKDKRGDWVLPKGHLDGDEVEEEAAYREILEETGIDSRIEQFIKRIAYRVTKDDVVKMKTVAFFLARAIYAEPVPEAREGIQEVRWVHAGEALAMIAFPDVREVVQQALDMLENN